MQNEDENTSGEFVSSISWEAAEYIHHEKDFTWTLLLVAGAMFFAALTFFILKDVFSVIVISMMALAVGFYGHRKPKNMTYQIGERGILIAGKVFHFDSFKSFSVLNEGSVKSIQLESMKRFVPPLSLYFPPEDEEKITDFLSNFLPYKKTQLDSVDKLFKKLRF